jgi:hypothetical protein
MASPNTPLVSLNNIFGRFQELIAPITISAETTAHLCSLSPFHSAFNPGPGSN